MGTTPNGLDYPELGNSANVPGYIQELAQDVDARYGPTVANVAALAGISDPFAGMAVWVTTPGDRYVYDGTDWEPSGLGAWTAYTPTLTQAAPLTKTVLYAKFKQCGKTIKGQVALAITSAGTPASAIEVGLPVAAAFVGPLVIGSAQYTDASPAQAYIGAASLFTTTTLVIVTNLGTSALGVNPAVTSASGDAVYATFTYETD